MTQTDADGQAIMEIALSQVEKFSEQDKTILLAEFIIYLWILGTGVENSSENIAKYLGVRAVKILASLSRDLISMNRAREESP